MGVGVLSCTSSFHGSAFDKPRTVVSSDIPQYAALVITSH